MACGLLVWHVMLRAVGMSLVVAGPVGLVEHWSTCLILLSFPLYPHQMTRTFAAASERGLRFAGSVMALHPFVTQGLCLLLGWAATATLLDEVRTRLSGDYYVVHRPADPFNPVNHKPNPSLGPHPNLTSP